MRMASGGEHLLIDGYNVLHDWEELRQQMRRSIDGAREHLIERVRVIRAVEGHRITLVFDGQGEQPEVEQPGEDPGFAVLYAPKGVSADGLIEQIVRRARQPQACQVISRDNMVIESIRAAGGYGYSPQDLLDWIRHCEAHQLRRIEQRSQQNQAAWKKDSPWDALG